MWIYFISLLVANTLGVTEAVAAKVISQDLHDYLFTNYSSNLIPICASFGNVTVNMDIALRQVMDLNEREQMLTVNIWLRLRWSDCRLTWDPTSYRNQDYFTVKYADVWTPDVTLFDSASEEDSMPGLKEYRVSISSSGSIDYYFPTVIKSVCKVDVRFFPFDGQRCKLKFGSWSHHGLELDLVNRNEEGDLSHFSLNSEWIIESLPAVRTELVYNCCPEPYPDVTYYVVMRRRPDFYFLTIVFPCILTSIVAAACFILPVESGEKVSLGVTVLLSMAVFLLLVSESMPPSSDNFPLVGYYFAISMALVSMSCCMTVLILNVFYHGKNGRRVPRWAKIIFFGYVGRAMCMGGIKVTTNSKTDPESAYDHETNKNNNVHELPLQEVNLDGDEESEVIMDELSIKNDLNGLNGLRMRECMPVKDPLLSNGIAQTKHIRDVNSFVNSMKTDNDINGEWRDLANILDRVFLVIYSLTTFITTLSLLLQCVGYMY